MARPRRRRPLTPADREFLNGFVRIGPETQVLQFDTADLLRAMGRDPARWKLIAISEDRDTAKAYFHLRKIETPDECRSREEREREALRGKVARRRI